MHSALALNKQTLRNIQRILNANGAVVVMGNYGEEENSIGPLAPTQFVSVHDLIVETATPIQTCPFLLKDGSFSASNNYRLAQYGKRWAYNSTQDKVQFQELRDDADNIGWERWVSVVELGVPDE